MNGELPPRTWMRVALRLAGGYNLLWGLLVITMPHRTLGWTGLDPPHGPPQIWQCLGMVISVYGIGYLIAAADPFRHWPIVLVGLLGKVFGPVGFCWGVISRTLPATMGWMILANDLIWWVPFAVILWSAFRFHQLASTVYAKQFHDGDPIRELTSQSGQTLLELTKGTPQLVVFLRHLGCPFCRETLADIARHRDEIEQLGAGIVLVHLGEDEMASQSLSKYGLKDLPRISDPCSHLYRQFGLEPGNFKQLFGWKVILRGVEAGFVEGHGMGHLAGNSIQMPGIFVVRDGQFLGGFQHEAACDRPDYIRLVQDAVKPESVAL